MENDAGVFVRVKRPGRLGTLRYEDSNWIIKAYEEGLMIPVLATWVKEETSLNLTKDLGDLRVRVFDHNGKELRS